jgi:hypothetical protein
VQYICTFLHGSHSEDPGLEKDKYGAMAQDTGLCHISLHGQNESVVVDIREKPEGQFSPGYDYTALVGQVGSL